MRNRADERREWAEAPPNKALEAGGARRLGNESFFSAPQLKRDPLGSIRPSRGTVYD